jgi:phenylpyruvate tautomerase PptA (4-oxalocrotonate tautomerase family)
VPTLHVHVTGKRIPSQQRALARSLTDAVCRSVDKRPEDVTIYFYYHAGGAHDMAFAGILESERRAARPKRSRKAIRTARR